MVSTSSSPPRSGVWYFSQGWKLVSLPGIRRFVILPLLINIILMGGAFWWLFTKLESWIPSLMSYVPDWLQWLNYLLWPVAVISVLLVFGYFAFRSRIKDVYFSIMTQALTYAGMLLFFRRNHKKNKK